MDGCLFVLTLYF